MGNNKLIWGGRPFTQLIRDSQFSAIGLVLLGELAKIGRILDEIIADNNNNNNGLGSRRLIAGTSSTADDNHSMRRSYGMEQSFLEEDVGERIQRQSSSKAEADNKGAVLGTSISKKARKVYVNEIDQLFDGLA